MALLVPSGHALVERIRPALEYIELDGHAAAGRQLAGTLASPKEDGLVVDRHAGAREGRPVREQSVQIEQEQTVRTDVRGNGLERRSELVLREQVVERVVEAGHQVERAQPREGSHVG